jgi:NADH:ubiquinone oxidoreductase subunit K
MEDYTVSAVFTVFQPFSLFIVTIAAVSATASVSISISVYRYCCRPNHQSHTENARDPHHYT